MPRPLSGAEQAQEYTYSNRLGVGLRLFSLGTEPISNRNRQNAICAVICWTTNGR